MSVLEKKCNKPIGSSAFPAHAVNSLSLDEMLRDLMTRQVMHADDVSEDEVRALYANLAHLPSVQAGVVKRLKGAMLDKTAIQAAENEGMLPPVSQTASPSRLKKPILSVRF